MAVVWHDRPRSDPACEVKQCETGGMSEIAAGPAQHKVTPKLGAAGAVERTRGGMGEDERRECESESGREGCKEAYRNGELVER